MKVTVCFLDIKVRVPCGTGDVKVSEVIDNAIIRFKKATQKANDVVVNVHKLKTKRDGGILDPDDILKDVVDDEELLIAIFDEYLQTLNHQDEDNNNNLNDEGSINSEVNSNDTEYDVKDEFSVNPMKNKIVVGESTTTKCMDRNEMSFNNINNNNKSHSFNVATPITMAKYNQKITAAATRDDTLSYFNRNNLNRQSKLNNSENTIVHSKHNEFEYLNNENETKHVFKLTNLQGALGIHVIPTFDLTSQKDMGMIIQQIEPTGRVFKDGRLRSGDRIVEINNKTLIGVSFYGCQDILRDAIRENELNLTVIRQPQTVAYHSVENEYDGRLSKQYQNGNHYRQLQQEQNDEIEIEILPQNEKIYESPDQEAKEEDEYHPEDLNGETINEKNESNEYEHESYVNNISPLYYQNQMNENKTNLNTSNTKKIGKKINIQLVKGPQGLGFKLAARDNPTGEISPIYIKNILPKGAAITDGRLQRGDRLLEVNGADMTVKSLHEAVNLLRNTKLGSMVDIVVSRQLNAFPRELAVTTEHEINQIIEYNNREMFTLEIPLNDTGSAGLGVSVKGKTKKLDDNETNVDLGIFVKTVINGGAASKDGRLKPNDQLININGFSLLGKSNEESMQLLRDAMQIEIRPGYIQLTVSRKRKLDTDTINGHEEDNTNKDTTNENLINESYNMAISQSHKRDAFEDQTIDEKFFSRDNPTRRSMSEKRKQASEVYSRIKVNKTADKPKSELMNKDIMRTGSLESIIGKSTMSLRPRNNDFDDLNKTLTPKKKQLQLSPSTLKKKTERNFIKTVPTQPSPHVQRHMMRKSNSIESIPSELNRNQYKIYQARPESSTLGYTNKYAQNTNNHSNWKSFRNNFNVNDYTYPLTNILNRQRIINRSFRTAVDKSFDVPCSDMSDDGQNNHRNNNSGNFGVNTQRMNYLRMSSQSEDSRKNKKTRKSLIETFQSFFKTTKREHKSPVELLNYHKSNDPLNYNENRNLTKSPELHPAFNNTKEINHF